MRKWLPGAGGDLKLRWLLAGFALVLCAAVNVASAGAGLAPGDFSPGDPLTAGETVTAPKIEVITPEQAYADGQVPGAEVEGSVNFADSFTTSTAAAYQACRKWPPSFSKGLALYHRTTTQTTSWCYDTRSHVITYRSTRTTPDNGTLCGVEAPDPTDWRVSGGIGSTWVKVHSEAHFVCDTPYWYKLHDKVWLEASYNGQGGAALEGWG